MASFGRNLRREREMRGISLEEIAQHTKIGTRLLEAIESDHFEQLPGGVFNRSFVLHYAHYLGLDEDQVGVEFDMAVGEAAAVDVVKVAAQRDLRADDNGTAVSAGSARTGRRAALIAALGILAVLAALSLWKWPRGEAAAPPAAVVPEASPSASVQAATTPVATSGPTSDPGATAAPAASTPGPLAGQPALRLQVDTMGRSWVAAWADGKKSWEADMEAQQTRVVEAESSLRLRVGNAGAVVLTLNGETQPPLGRKGESRTVEFSREDLKKQ